MEVDSVMITGANRGLGLEFVKQIVNLPKPPKYVFATYRSKDTLRALEEVQDLSKTSKVILIKMDVTSPNDLVVARKIVEETVQEEGLNLLINNAGAARGSFFPEVTEENINFHFATNTIGPVMILKEMLPMLQKAAARKEGDMCVSRACVLNISTSAASTTRACGKLDETQPKEWLSTLAYRASKAALNMSMRVIAFTVKEQGILVVQMCPGWVKTDLGTEWAEITSEESISCMLQTLTKLNERNTGAFLDRNGDTIIY